MFLDATQTKDIVLQKESLPFLQQCSFLLAENQIPHTDISFLGAFSPYFNAVFNDSCRMKEKAASIPRIQLLDVYMLSNIACLRLLIIKKKELM
jgi:hypothetical protein